MIRVRIAQHGDEDRLIRFVHDHWASDHIFVGRPEVFEWQHLQGDGRLNVILAERDDDPEPVVLGMLGFIPMGRFSPVLGDTDVLLAIWKVRDGAPPGLGLRLLKFLQADLSPRLIAAIGTSKMVRPIYEVLGYQVGTMHQSAVFNPDRRDDLAVASGIPAAAFESAGASDEHVELRPVGRDDADHLGAVIDRIAGAATPTKNWEYLTARYLDHPWYRYEVRLVVRSGEPTAAAVWRSVAANGTHVLRIVDIIGDTTWLGDAHAVLQAEVRAVDAEYIDLMQWGVDDTLLRDGGFVATDTESGVVIPNYFSPFVPNNVEIEMAVKVRDDSVAHLYRADSDQDRPNQAADLADRTGDG